MAHALARSSDPAHRTSHMVLILHTANIALTSEDRSCFCSSTGSLPASKICASALIMSIISKHSVASLAFRRPRPSMLTSLPPSTMSSKNLTGGCNCQGGDQQLIDLMIACQLLGRNASCGVLLCSCDRQQYTKLIHIGSFVRACLSNLLVFCAATSQLPYHESGTHSRNDPATILRKEAGGLGGHPPIDPDVRSSL